MEKSKPPLASLSREDYEKRLKKIILAGLGKAWMFWPPRSEVKKRCKINDRNDVHFGWFVCEKCGEHREKLEIDHINPCIKPSEGFVSWDEYIKRRFVFDAKDLQGLCHECHKSKSKAENKARKEAKNGD